MTSVFSRFRHFLLDDEGSMTIEFVIWIPWLLFYLMFSTTAYLAMDSRLEAMRASITLTDIVSRQDAEITEQQFTDWQVMMNQLTPSATAGGMIRVSVIEADSGPKVKATKCIGGIEALTEDNMPVDILPPMAEGSEVILVETFIPYDPVSRVFGIQPVTWENRKFVIPRFVPQVEFDAGVNSNCGSIPAG